MTITINGSSLKIEDLVSVARFAEKVDLSENSWKRIEDCREMLEKKINDNEIIYGINTGIGEFSPCTHQSLRRCYGRSPAS